MENSWMYLSLIVFLLLIFKFLVQRNKRAPNLPPSPPFLPFIGYILLLLRDPLHKALNKISQKYGPVISLRLGTRLVVVVSSPSAVEDCLSKHDAICANRPYLLIGKYLGYNFNTLVNAPYGDHWRNLRRISLLELLSPNRLNLSVGIRRDEVMKVLTRLYRSSSHEFAKVELHSVLTELNFNVTLRMLAGKRYNGEGVVDCEEKVGRLMELVKEVLEFFVTMNAGDFFPILKWIDYGTGYMRSIKKLSKKTDDLLQGLIDDHRGEVSSTDDQETFIDRMLGLQESEPEYYTDDTIKGLLLVLLFAGTDTTSGAMEWAMSLLLNNPEALEKAKSEIDIQVGQTRMINELDVPGLKYLQSIISETLRMFPSVPLLLPHMSSQDCQIGGFDIPRGTTLLVNAWAVHRDPNLWNEPAEFKPEMFQSKDVDHYKYLPFGVGRRSCPGAPLANRMMGLALGTLIQCFEWKRVGDEKVDLTEGRAVFMPKAQPLEAMCKSRPIMSNTL